MELFNKCVIFSVLFVVIHVILRHTKKKDILKEFEEEDTIDKLKSQHFNSLYDLFNNQKRKILSQNDTLFTLNDSNITIVDYGYQNSYYFLNNITSYQYYGSWNNSIPTRNFQYNSGNLVVSISKNNTSIRNFIENIENYEVLYISILFYDGFYIDHWMNFSFNIHFEKNFSQKIKKLSESITLENEITISKIVGEFNDQINFTTCENSKVSLQFIRKPQLSINQANFNTEKIEFSEVRGNLRSNDCLFDITFDLSIKNDEKNHVRVWNYSLILSSIAMVEIYLTLKLIYSVSENTTLGSNISLVTICLNIIWNSFICTIHFFLSITYDQYSFDFGLPSLLYFLLFSIFELRLLFFIWKSRYYNLFFNNHMLFRQKLIKFYSIFYTCLFFSLITMKYLFSSDLSNLIFFSITWVPQIIHNIQNSTRQPLKFKYIFAVSFGKLFVPLYIRGCPYNIFLIKPKPTLIIIIALSIITEVVILFLQKVFGPKCIIPSFLRKKPYNYYIDINDKECLKYNSECIICLEPFFKTNLTIKNENVLNIQENNNIKEGDQINKNEQHKELEKLPKNCLQKLKEKFNNFVLSLKKPTFKKNHMLTPCKHLFHTDCLEPWMNKKPECPFCRNKIPSLE